MTFEGAVSSNSPVLVVRTRGFDRRLQAGPAYKIGRDPASDIVVDDSRVSWQHAVLRLEHDCWLLEDSGSTNGTYLDAQRVRRGAATSARRARARPPESRARGVLPNRADGPCRAGRRADGHRRRGYPVTWSAGRLGSPDPAGPAGRLGSPDPAGSAGRLG